MKLSELFNCDKPVPFLEWFNRIISEESVSAQPSIRCDEDVVYYAAPVNEFLSQPFTKDMVIKPDEPHPMQYVKEKLGMDKNAFKTDHEVWKNWQPVFLGEWTTSKEDSYVPMAINLPEWNGGCEIYEDMTIDEVIKYSNDFELPLQLNPNYEI